MVFHIFSLLLKAVAAEKQHFDLISGVEHFDKASMKHAETEEKNQLPPIEGTVAACTACLCFHVLFV